MANQSDPKNVPSPPSTAHIQPVGSPVPVSEEQLKGASEHVKQNGNCNTQEQSRFAPHQPAKGNHNDSN
jgi:hypothetical protein